MGVSDRKEKMEFGGIPGNLAIIFGLPLVVYLLYFSIRFNGGHILPPEGGPPLSVKISLFLESIVPTGRAAAIFLTWFLFQALLQRFMPGKVVEGVTLSDGTRLKYRMNGMASFLVTLAAAGVLYFTGIIGPEIIHDNFGALISVAVIFVFAFSFFLYFYSKKTGQVDRPSGSAIHDFFMGVALNPRIPPVTGFDLKLFCEARPSLMGWLMVTFSFAGVQYQRQGEVTLAMALVVAFQFLYIADYFWHEEAILTTTDVVHDKFGFMLAFGDLAWVPLTYCVQAFYLVDHAHELPLWGAALILAVNMTGYYIFRAVNIQKHRFRREPGRTIWGKEPEFIQTEQGNRLLVSGFWGWARHFNYVGDIMMALAWSLPCLFDSIVPYFYPIYFTILLIHRERRDDNQCLTKYGEDWLEYRRRVPWRILPFIY